jgi:hypothetical protein
MLFVLLAGPVQQFVVVVQFLYPSAVGTVNVETEILFLQLKNISYNSLCSKLLVILTFLDA